jgi:RNA polymerase-interacting CarD/CdnL/TRCF family regulator
VALKDPYLLQFASFSGIVGKDVRNQEVAMQRFKVGQDVSYAQSGPAIIKDIVTVSVGTASIEMYILSPYDNAGNATIQVPVTTKQLRDIVTPTQASTALQTLTRARKQLRGPPHRQLQHLTDSINTGDFMKLCEAVRDLYTDEGVERRYTRRMMYESSLRRLTHELSLVFDLSPTELEPLVEEIIIRRKIPDELKAP